MSFNTTPTDRVMEQLLLLKRATVNTGVIHEAQKLQLQNWPRMMNHVKSVDSVGIDHEKRLVVFNCQKNDIKPKATDLQLYPAILSWVKLILWDDTDVVFKLGKKTVYDSRAQ